MIKCSAKSARSRERGGTDSSSRRVRFDWFQKNSFVFPLHVYRIHVNADRAPQSFQGDDERRLPGTILSKGSHSMGVAVCERTSTEVIFGWRDDKVSALGAGTGEATHQIV